MTEYQIEEMKRCMAVIKGICTDILSGTKGEIIKTCPKECPMYKLCDYNDLPCLWEIY